MPRSNPQQDEKYCSCDPRQTHGDFHNKIGQQQTWRRCYISENGFRQTLQCAVRPPTQQRQG
jgi:hypothetical protein